MNIIESFVEATLGIYPNRSNNNKPVTFYHSKDYINHELNMKRKRIKAHKAAKIARKRNRKR